MRISMRLGVMLMILLGLAGLVPAPLSVVSAHTEEVELQRRVDEIRREMEEKSEKRFEELKSDMEEKSEKRFEELKSGVEWRDRSVDRWLMVIGLIFTVFALAVPVLAALGFKEFQKLKSQAEKSTADIDRAAKAAQEAAQRAAQETADIEEDAETAEKAAETAKEAAQRAVREAEEAKETKGNIHQIGSDPFLARSALDPEANRSPFNEANTAETAKQLDEAVAAITECNQILATNPDDAEAYYKRGSAKIVLERYQWAIDDFNQVISRESTNAAAYNSRGFARNMLNQYEPAIADFDAALRLNPNYARAYINRGMTKVDRDLAKEAKADWETALKLAEEQGRVKLKRLIEELLKTIQPLLSAEVGGSGR